MSYEVLARRWRPQTFDEVAGQRHVTVTLANALRSEHLPHAILLAGPRGVGKTSIARILARSLNCDEGPTVKPCGRCPSCVEIAASNSMAVQEIDAASHTGVDNMREILDSVRYAAAPGKYRIFIIDEVHMLSQPAFNALLKTLEEPPPHVLFVLATTEPQKIPATVLSRVQRFDLKRLAASELLARLRQIQTAEGIQLTESVLRAVVREADGSLRDALTLLDRLISGFGPTISEADAMAVLDLVDRRTVLEVLDPVLAQDPAAALGALRRALDNGIAPGRFAGDLLEEIRNHVVASVVSEPAELIQAADDEVAEIRQRAAAHDVETFQRLFRVLLTRVQDLGFAPRPAHVLEMAVVRLATLPASESLTRLIARLDALERGDPADPGPGGSDGGSGRRASADAQRSGAARGGGPARPPAPRGPSARTSGAAPTTRPTTLEDARLHSQVKSHPLVLQIIHELDAELREIRVRPLTRADASAEEDAG